MEAYCVKCKSKRETQIHQLIEEEDLVGASFEAGYDG